LVPYLVLCFFAGSTHVPMLHLQQSQKEVGVDTGASARSYVSKGQWRGIKLPQINILDGVRDSGPKRTRPD
jgi:hypothetical protein